MYQSWNLRANFRDIEVARARRPAPEVVGAQRLQIAGGAQLAGVHGLAPRPDEVHSRGEVGVDL